MDSISLKRENYIKRQLSIFYGTEIQNRIPIEVAEFFLGLRDKEIGILGHWDKSYLKEKEYSLPEIIFEPVINQWVRKIKAQQPEKSSSINPNFWPEERPFAACLTHDVDFVTSNSLIETFRRLRFSPYSKKMVYLREVLGGVYRRINDRLFFAKTEKDPFWCFEKWLEIEDKYNFRSTFFFLPDNPSRYQEWDCFYRHHDKIEFEGQKIIVAELMTEMDKQGWEIGLHGTFYSYDDANELRIQKEQVENSLGKNVFSIRQHLLHYDIKITPKVQAQAGFKFDSTLGFNHTTGFRRGAAFPFFQYDIENEIELSIVQIPMHIQDGALFRKEYMGLNPESAINHCLKLVEKVEKENGLLTLSWHPQYYDSVLFPGWFHVYEELLSYLHKKNAWVTSVGEIGRWWESQERKLMKI